MRSFEHPQVFGLVTKYPRKKSNLALAKKINTYFRRYKINAVYLLLETKEADIKKIKKAAKLMDLAGVDLAKEFQD